MKEMKTIIGQFLFDGTYIDAIPFGDGHINDTFLLEFEKDGRKIHYILQKMNLGVADRPRLLMQNIGAVTRHIEAKIEESNYIPTRETLRFIPTASGDYCYMAEEGVYRASHFIAHAKSYDAPQSMEHIKECGKILGYFEKDLADFVFDSDYVEMTKNFHNTVHRYDLLMEAAEKDLYGRAKEVQEELLFFKGHKEQAGHLLSLAEENKLPFRATHNDLRLSNILIHKETKKATALVDLDTVMPGLAAYDYGDAIRSAAKHVYRENGVIVGVELDLQVAAAFTEGYLEVAGDFLTEMEISTLWEGILTMSLELGMRYLTDYLNGDVYFKKNKNGENKANARRELLFVKEILKHANELKAMVRR